MPYGNKKSYSFFKMKGMSFGNSPLNQNEEGGDEKKPKPKRNNPCADHYQKWADKCGAIDQSTQDGKNAYNRCRAQRQAALIKLECL